MADILDASVRWSPSASRASPCPSSARHGSTSATTSGRPRCMELMRVAGWSSSAWARRPGCSGRSSRCWRTCRGSVWCSPCSAADRGAGADRASGAVLGADLRRCVAAGAGARWTVASVAIRAGASAAWSASTPRARTRRGRSSAGRSEWIDLFTMAPRPSAGAAAARLAPGVPARSGLGSRRGRPLARLAVTLAMAFGWTGAHWFYLGRAPTGLDLCADDPSAAGAIFLGFFDAFRFLWVDRAGSTRVSPRFASGAARA